MWLSALWIQIRFYVLAAAGILAAVGVAMYWAWIKGKAHAAGQVRQARQEASEAKATTKAYRTRNEVDEYVEKFEDAGEPQKVATAAPDTAAGRLRKRWIR